MKMFPFLAATLFFVVFAAQIQAQKKVSTIDDYLDTAGTIVVAKCIGVGPVNILLRADVDVEILHVVKGKETLRIITVASQFRMELGQTYLLKTKYQASPDQPYFKAETRDAVVLVSVSENMALLKTFSPRIVVLRTMNTQIENIEAEIQFLSYELAALKAARKED